MVFAGQERELADTWIGLATVGGTSHRQLRAVDVVALASSITEVNHDEAVENVALSIVGQRRVGPEVEAIHSADGIRQRNVHRAPGGTAVRGKIPSHGVAENLVRTASENITC